MTIDDQAQDWTRALNDVRIELGQSSIEAFSKIYLPHHFGLPPSSMHQEIFALLEGATRERNARLAIAAPRGHAKSTLICVAYVLWSICHSHEPFIVLFSNTAEQAADHLAAVKKELETNPYLLDDFPQVAEPPGARPTPKRWRRGEIVTRNGVKVLALGAGQQIRGRKHGQHRPSLIILDDVENQQEVLSAELRDQKMAWLQRAVMKAGVTAKTNLVVAGTILHYDSLLARLLDRRSQPGWETRRYQAVLGWAVHLDLWQRWGELYSHQEELEGQSGPKAAGAFFAEHEEAMLEGSKVLWPEMESYFQLMEVRLNDGQASFDSEKQNEPVDPDSCYFPADSLRFWDDRYPTEEDLRAKLGDQVKLFGACDPSLGKVGKNRDNTAIVTVLLHGPTDTFYVLDADIKKRKPDATLETILGYHRLRTYKKFGMESVQFQEYLAEELIRKGAKERVRLQVEKIKQTTDKLGRIQSLEPLIATGRLQFSRRQRTLVEELRQFPMGRHDDGPDALEMAITVAREPEHYECWDPL